MKKVCLLKITELDGVEIPDFDVESDSNHKVYEELFNSLEGNDINFIGFTNEDNILIDLDEDKISKIENVLSDYFIIDKNYITIKDAVSKYPELVLSNPMIFLENDV